MGHEGHDTRPRASAMRRFQTARAEDALVTAVVDWSCPGVKKAVCRVRVLLLSTFTMVSVTVYWAEPRRGPRQVWLPTTPQFEPEAVGERRCKVPPRAVPSPRWMTAG